MEEWKLEIKRVQNGYILKEFNSGDNLEILIEDKISNLETMKELLLEVKEYFGVYYSDNNQENLVVEIVKEEQKEFHTFVPLSSETQSDAMFAILKHDNDIDREYRKTLGEQ